ncbi:MAG: sulfate adenylyltransferase [Bacteroidetes bacterium]|nr:sulfate adenylyltransferase [Bacteroidota bacterium]
MNNSGITIIATIGPTSLKENIIEEMDRWGTDIFRINLSHTAIEDLDEVINKLRSWTKKPICLDTEGAQIRTGKYLNGQIVLQANSLIEIVKYNEIESGTRLSIYPIIPEEILRVGDVLRIDFHSVIVQVIKVEDKSVLGRVIEGGIVGSNKGISIDRMPYLPAFTDKDYAALLKGKELGITHYALSFTYKKEDIIWVREQFDYPVFIISKIESYNALSNLKDIVRATDAILIDRGDLSKEVPLQKVGVMQKYIVNFANKFEKPVYVATNLLDSMISGLQPNRAEINDITSTLFNGAQGLVLAAETAIGNHPVEVVRMAAGIIEETTNYLNHYTELNIHKYIDKVYENSLILPHGGELVQNYLDEDAKEIESKNLPKIYLDEQTALDLEQLASGTYSPITGFMDLREMDSVLDAYRLIDGNVWTLPILLQMNKEDIGFRINDKVLLYSKQEDKLIGMLEVKNIERISDLNSVAKRWFNSSDDEHPGVRYFKSRGDYIISGDVFRLRRDSVETPYVLTPKQIRSILRDLNMATVVGFHTRNVLHRGHEFIQKKALEMVNADGLLISPVIGPKKKGDFVSKAIIGSYEKIISKGLYDPFKVLLGAFSTYSRYSGPREAVFTALCRKNFGCSHFIIGRDHTGVGDYYSANASQEIFEKIGEIGIKPIFFETAYYCNTCGYVTNGCQHLDKDKIKLSATEIRNCLISNKRPPEYLLREEISDLLVNMMKENEQIFIS